jgi:hypothetical protein
MTSTTNSLGAELGYKISLVIPAGRRRYLELLIPQILKQEGWDDLSIWINTTDPGDLAYLQLLPALDSRISLVLPPTYRPDGAKTIAQFFPLCTSPDTLYIRFDDDICFLEKGVIPRIARYRAAHPDPFLVSPVVINNAIVTYILQVLGRLSYPTYLTANCLDPIAWNNPAFAEELHRTFLSLLQKGQIDYFKFPGRPVAINRFSINCISWLGSDFQKFKGYVSADHGEEEYLSVIKPTQLGKANYIMGDCIVSHFAFFTQREYLDKTDILDSYARFVSRY